MKIVAFYYKEVCPLKKSASWRNCDQDSLNYWCL